MEGPEPIRIMVVDDHPALRSGLVAIIEKERDMTVVAQAANGREAVERFHACRPSVILMDLRMPVMSGLEAIVAIRKESPQARIIVLTTFDGDEDIYRALQAGARGYLLKDTSSQDLVGAVRTVHAGQRSIPATVAQRLADRMTSPELSGREIEVLSQIVQGKSNKEIASALFISESTVKGHINNILNKLGADDRTEAAMIAVQRGFVHLDSQKP